MLTTTLQPTRYLRRTPRGGGLTLTRGADSRLWAVLDEERIPVVVRRCFPWSEPSRYISLRDTENREVALIRAAHDLDPASRNVLEAALAEAGFVIEVTGVLEIEEEVEIRQWRVVTRQGARVFQTRLDDWPERLPDGGLLVRDVGGDLYRLPTPQSADRRSRELLWAFVD